MTLVQELARIVGEDHLITSPEAMLPYVTDQRKRFKGRAAAVVFPKNTEEVSEVMRFASSHGVAVIPQSGNTSNVAGATPDDSDEAGRNLIILSTKRMNRILCVDPVNNTATVEAGVVLQNLQEAADRAGRLFPLSLAAEGSCCIGGNLASNAGGIEVLSYGNARDLCLGLEVVLPDGEILPMLRGVRKNNAGYDLKQLFIGSEGTLGVITAATVKLFPKPSGRVTAFAALSGLDSVETLFSRVSETAGPGLTAFELMSDAVIRKTCRVMPQVRMPLETESPWYVLLEISVFGESDEAPRAALESILGEMLESGVLADAAIAESLSDEEDFWRLRESIPSAHKAAGGNIKHDISVPRSALCRFIRETCASLEEKFPWIAPSVFGHYGDGNLHFNMGCKEPLPASYAFQFEDEVHLFVHRAVAAAHGSIAAEHGVGRIKREDLLWALPEAELKLMRRIKAALDPEGIMNPGRVIP